MCAQFVVLSILFVAAQASADFGPEKLDQKGKREAPEVAAGRLGEQLRKHPAKPSAKPGNLALHLLDTESGKATLIADEIIPGLVNCRLMEWSHDGRRIVFHVCNDNWWNAQICTIELGQEKPLVRKLGSGCWPSLTEDSEKILFMLYAGMGGATEAGIWIMNADGTDRRKLELEGRPRLGPDSRFCLVCSLTKPPTLQIVDTGSQKLLDVRLPDRQFFSWPSWVDGETFVGMTGKEEGDRVSLVDVSNPERIALKEDLWTRPQGTTMRPRSPVYVARTGRGYFITREPGKTNAVYEFRRGKPEIKRFDSTEGEELEGLGVSPGGRYILFSRDRANKPGN